MRIHIGGFVLAPVAKEIIELLQPGRIVAAPAPEDDGCLLIGMHVEHVQGPIARSSLRIARGSKEEDRAGHESRGRRHLQNSTTTGEPVAISLSCIRVTSQLASASLPKMGAPETSNVRQQS